MPDKLVADIRPHRGALALHLNGRVQPCTSYKITETPDTAAMLASAEAEIPGLARQGIRHCWVPVFIDWSGPGQYDFSDLDRRIATVLRLYDQHTPAGQEPAVIAVRVQAAVFSPPWYIDRFLDAAGQPTNLIEFRNPWGKAEPGRITHEMRFATRIRGYDSTYAISPGDAFWDTHAIDCLTAIVRHVQGQPYAHRVFGWLPCAFSTNEWFIHTDATAATCDHSRPAQEAFGRYLDRQGIEGGPAPVPSPAACQQGDGIFLDPAQPADRVVEAFSHWINQRMVELIGRFARTIREHYGPERKLVGVFYGYTTELSPIHHLAQSGHLGLRELLANPDLDFICSPCQYRYRADEGDFTYSQVLGAAAHSAALHGKLAILEDDHPPAFCPATYPSFTTRDAWHDEMYFRRNLAQVLAQGQYLWWYSLGAQWMRDPARQALVGGLHRLAGEALERDRRPVAEIAVVVDERSVAAMRLNPELQKALLLQSYTAWYPVGAPFEFHELHSFLARADHGRFKVVCFLNLFLADAATRAAVGQLKSANRTLIFQVASGYLTGSEGERRSIAAAGELVGMTLREEPVAQALSVWIDPARTSFLPGGADVRYGWLDGARPVKPVLSVADPEAEALGYLYSGTPGLARRRHGEWTSIYSAAPRLPTAVLRECCRQAGVHLYTESGDLVYANHSLVAIVAASCGEKQLTMPSGSCLVDALSGDRIQLDGTHACRLVMKRHETRLFWRED